MVPRYHRKSLELIGVTPHVSPGAIEELAEVERRIGRPLPASVREWYSLADACELLEEYSNADPPVPRDKLGSGERSKFLVFRRENQGVCRWAIRLNSSDDPPVLVDYDYAEDTWIRCTDRFSDYVYCCMWDFARVLKGVPVIQAQHSAISTAAMEFLSREFKRVLDSQGWPADRQYRFQRLDQRILIWSGERQADWWLKTDSPESLASLARTVWECDGVGRSFWSNDDEGTLILRSIDGRSGMWPPGR